MTNKKILAKKIAQAKRIVSACAVASISPARWAIYWSKRSLAQ